jgi:zinc transporter ZupT
MTATNKPGGIGHLVVIFLRSFIPKNFRGDFDHIFNLSLTILCLCCMVCLCEEQVYVQALFEYGKL